MVVALAVWNTVALEEVTRPKFILAMDAREMFWMPELTKRCYHLVNQYQKELHKLALGSSVVKHYKLYSVAKKLSNRFCDMFYDVNVKTNVRKQLTDLSDDRLGTCRAVTLRNSHDALLGHVLVEVLHECIETAGRFSIFYSAGRYRDSGTHLRSARHHQLCGALVTMRLCCERHRLAGLSCGSKKKTPLDKQRQQLGWCKHIHNDNKKYCQNCTCAILSMLIKI